MSQEIREQKILLAGFGGQGVLFAGKVISYTGLIEDRELSWMPSYGPEMRGGAANCSVTLSDSPIGAPEVKKPTTLIAMNQPSFDKFAEAVEPGGLIVTDKTLVPRIKEVENVKICHTDASEILIDNKLSSLLNMFLLGKFFAETHFCKEENLFKALEKCIPEKRKHLVEPNTKAIKLGIEN